MRGKRRADCPDTRAGRIIPAHAGQTAPPWRVATSRTDHPRACGANICSGSSHRTPAGSSPRMRGKRALRRAPWRCRRIIPAHAGQTDRLSHLSRRFSDHPRACGANFGFRQILERVAGSSPRMRGKRSGGHGRAHLRRIIPAHAGQTVSEITVSNDPTDHPRACGATREIGLVTPAHAGSSPRMRGKLCLLFCLGIAVRIIPAHAGQTCFVACPVSGSSDHPRACGANRRTVAIETSTSGSSPRMRGKHCSGCGVRRGGRIIPAHAGQTRAW